ncbi:esterase [Endozoicomonas sp.]|nr:esterase [Endozoicomonas sp.]
MKKNPLLIYLHGLNSAPQSEKAQRVKNYIEAQSLAVDYWIPKLPHWPKHVRTCLLGRILPEAKQRPILIIGSSLGGFFGTWLQAYLQNHRPKSKPRLVLVNPAAEPFRLFENYLGPQQNTYTSEHWELTMKHVEQLRAMEVKILFHPESRLLLAQTGDETLDYQLAMKKYAGSPHIIQEGGSHAFDHFDTVLPDIFSFLLAH